MSVPYGAPQQQAGSPAQPAGGFSLPSILALVGAGLGLIVYLLAFGEAGIAPSLGIGGGPGTATSLLLIAGLLAGISLLPKGPQLHLLFAVLAVLGVLGLLQVVVHWSGDLPPMTIVALIVGLVEAGVLVTAWLFNAEILKVTPKPAYPQGNWNPQSGGIPQAGQPGQYGQAPQGQFGQQAQFGQAEQQYGQQNPGTGGQPAQPTPYAQGTEVFGGTQQPGQYGQQPGTTPPPGGYGQS
ncbi:MULTISPECIES: DUF5336 domain-containing protein [Actinoalloteichus]|uniref:Uncharacterized protein n=1 Tax=Actinoalloteichus fjordicus TaxID=1612552 RepID=A0AAC9LIU8_9PSEU|nr:MULTISPECIES: DUF5336 domain-containing protein [Actinoalloteichus]APU17537.1 hypothetical protein UA74_27670 [Actinoalloteichus fjordicus]APU23613.1 hypothetical protein UA75_28210 [Actinoalloteichus sp. GBA129-24]